MNQVNIFLFIIILKKKINLKFRKNFYGIILQFFTFDITYSNYFSISYNFLGSL